MVNQRNRIVVIKDYIESFGIDVNIGKNKAQGNKGYFKAKNEFCRIDIAKGLDDEGVISTLCHEFSHFIHYCYDKKLKTLDFIFDDYDETIQNELIEITVNSIPKENIKPLFEAKELLKREIKELGKKLASNVPDFKLSIGSPVIEKLLKKTPYKYLLKHDRVKVLGFFNSKIYTIDNIKADTKISESEIDYLLLKSKQRALKRINSRISKLNRYYNSNTELFARSVELYVKDKESFKMKAPFLYNKFTEALEKNQVPELTQLVKLAQI